MLPFSQPCLSFLRRISQLLLVSASVAPASLIFSDGGTHTVDTFISDYIEVRNDSSGNPTTVTFNAGAIITGVDPYDDTMFVRGSSSAIVNGGSFSNDVSGYNRASISIFGGLFNDDIYTANMAQVKIFGGIIAEDLVAEDSSSITVTGGSFGRDIEALGGSIFISGGSLAANGLGNLGVGIGSTNGGLVSLTGTSFMVDGVDVGSGAITPLTGILSGVLSDGTAFSNIPFDRRSNGGGTGTIQLSAVPEPSSFLLFSIIASSVFSRQRARYRQLGKSLKAAS